MLITSTLLRFLSSLVGASPFARFNNSVTRIKFLHILSRHLERCAAELNDSPDYRDGLARWKECRILIRQMGVELDYIENVLKIQYHEQTRLRAVADLWKKLNSEIIPYDTPTPPKKLVKRKKVSGRD